MAWRNLLNIRRNPQLLVFATIQPVIFVLMFRYVFGGAIQAASGRRMTYVDFLMPGDLRADDRVRRAHHRRRPRRRPAARASSTGSARCRWRARRCSSGRTLADLVRNFFVVILMCVVGFIVGWTIGTNVVGLLGAIADHRSRSRTRCRGCSRSSASACKDAETAQAVSFPILAPLVFASSAFVPVATMPSWLQGWAKNQPVSVVINAARDLTIGRPGPERVVGPEGDRVDRRHRRGECAHCGRPLPQGNLIAQSEERGEGDRWTSSRSRPTTTSGSTPPRGRRASRPASAIAARSCATSTARTGGSTTTSRCARSVPVPPRSSRAAAR